MVILKETSRSDSTVKVKVKSAQITQHKEKESSTQYMSMQSGLEFTHPLSLFHYARKGFQEI